ncbi:MAG TPA: thioredoxin domain-containing protein [Rhizomicrobium sp.]|jgi:hypothetical protein
MSHLDTSTSPYLQLHKDNPVDWYGWGPEAFAAAEASNKPIFLSIGYTACHWCHLMNAESFGNGDIAAQMNDSFINVLVDREERPDVDLLYQAASNAMGHMGGWPLNIFLTPKGEPYFVTGYLPPEERNGIPAIQTVLRDMVRSYQEQREQIQATGDRVTGSLRDTWNRDMRGNIDTGFLNVGAIRTAQRHDIFYGGIQGNVRFPNAPSIEVMWRGFLRNGTPQFSQLTATTLDHICFGALRDHIGGGFFRYCVDERWLMPHFEKMLTDNALLIDVLTLVWQYNRNALCQGAVDDAIGWLLREMKVGDAFASNIDADSEGEEGKYYLWSEAEVDAALMGTFVQRFKAAYNIRREGNLQGANPQNSNIQAGRNIPHRLNTQNLGQFTDADEAMLAKQRELLLAARQSRVRPMRDDKVLADRNGYAIAALAHAGTAFQRSDWLTAAIRAFDFVVKVLGDGGRLYHSWFDGKRTDRSFADDYASMARAALALWESTNEKRFLEHAKRWTRTLNEEFWDAKGGYCVNAQHAEPLIVSIRTIFDQPSPPANSVMLGVLARLHMATADQSYYDRAQEIALAFAGEAPRAWQSMATYLNELEFLGVAANIVIIGPNDHVRTHELTQAVFGRSFPNRLVTVVSPDEMLPEGHPAYGKTMQNGQPTAYLCQRNTCSPPITNPVQLSQILQLPQQKPQQQGAAPQQMARA